MNKLARGLFLTVALLLMSLSVSFAGVLITPTGIGYQGRLTDAAGAPVNGARDLTLALYDAPTAGTLLYSETQSAVTVTNGLFSVEVGTGTPVTGTFAGVNFSTHNIFLGIAVGADPEMTPRVHLSFAPYSMNSKDSPGLAAGHNTGFAFFSTTASVALSSAQITIPGPGWILVMAEGQLSAPAAMGAVATWINETPAGTFDTADYGYISNPGAAQQYYQYSRFRIFRKDVPGTYTFYLNVATSPAGGYLWQLNTSAIYIPLAMGTVGTTASLLATPPAQDAQAATPQH